jgi:hypothetical protein
MGDREQQQSTTKVLDREQQLTALSRTSKEGLDMDINLLVDYLKLKKIACVAELPRWNNLYFRLIYLTNATRDRENRTSGRLMLFLLHCSWESWSRSEHTRESRGEAGAGQAVPDKR